MGFLEEMGSQVASSLSGIATQGISQLLGLSWSPNKAMQKQKEYNEYIMGLQYNYQQQAAAQEQKYAKEYWDYTNAENQKQHLKNAGLNPALMYGQSGAGGMGATGGAKQGAPQQPQGNPIAMGLQAQAQNAEIELMRAQAAKANAEAVKISGVDSEKVMNEIENLKKQNDVLIEQGKWYKADTGLKEIETKIQQAYEEWASVKAKKEATTLIDSLATMYSNQARLFYNQAGREFLTTDFERKTFDMRYQRVTAELAYWKLQDNLAQSEINVNEAQEKQLNKLADSLVKLAAKYESDAKAFAKEVDGQVKRWEEQTDLEKWGMTLKSIETGINGILDIIGIFFPKLKVSKKEIFDKKGEKKGETIVVEKTGTEISK